MAEHVFNPTSSVPRSAQWYLEIPGESRNPDQGQGEDTPGESRNPDQGQGEDTPDTEDDSKSWYKKPIFWIIFAVVAVVGAVVVCFVVFRVSSSADDDGTKPLYPLSISANPLRDDPKKTQNPPSKGLFEASNSTTATPRATIRARTRIVEERKASGLMAQERKRRDWAAERKSSIRLTWYDGGFFSWMGGR